MVPKSRSRVLAGTFWGRARCHNLAAYATLANRLERGRCYLRSGLVIDLQIQPGAVAALVSGSDVYQIRVAIKPMPASRWKALVKGAAGRIESVVELLAGRFDEGVMAHVCHQGTGLFPVPAEISYRCTCPDGSGGGWLCKHVGATLYGVGIRLDEDPELLFRLRRVTATDLVTHVTERLTTESSGKSSRRSIATDQLSSVFGIEPGRCVSRGYPRAESPLWPFGREWPRQAGAAGAHEPEGLTGPRPRPYFVAPEGPVAARCFERMGLTPPLSHRGVS